MKKSKKTTASNKVQTPRGQRHASSKTKPVTIDLKAEEVAEKKTSSTAKPSQPTKKSAASTSATASPKAPSPATKASSEEKKAEAKTASASDGSTATSSKPKESKPTPAPGPSAPKSSATAMPPNPKARKSRDFGGRFVAALVGGCVALGGAGLLQYAGILGSPADSSATYQQKLDSQSQTFNQQIEELKAQIANSDTSLEERVKQNIGQLLETAGTANTDEMISQINETTIRVEQLMADQKTNATMIGKLQEAIQAASSTSQNNNGSGGGGSGAALSALSLQVDNLLSQSRNIRDDIKKLQSEQALLKTASPASDLSTNQQVTSRLSGLENEVGKLPGLLENLNQLQAKLTSNAEAIEAQMALVNQLKDQLDRPGSSGKLAARSVAASALKNDIDRGLPFADSLNLLKSLSDGDASLSKLDNYATDGIPTSSQLTATFQAIADNIVEATKPKPGEDLTSRLLAGVKSFVKVKARKPIEGTTPLAIVSQISQALMDNDLQTASSLWGTLPEAGQTVSADWHNQLQSRIIANELITNSLQSFLSSSATQ